MNANEYQEKAARTLAKEANLNNLEWTIVKRVILLAMESCKLMELVKKQTFHKKGLNRQDLRKQLLDVDRNLVMLRHTIESDKTPVAVQHDKTADMLYWSLAGLLGEAGEVAESILGHINSVAATDEELGEEIGDQQFYVAAICTVLGIKMGDVLEQNIVKLEKRHPDGFTIESAQAQADKYSENDD